MNFKKFIDSVKNGTLIGVGLSVGVIATTVIAATTFQAGDTLTADDLNEISSAIAILSPEEPTIENLSGTTPDVSGLTFFHMDPTTDVDITDFMGGITGQEIKIILNGENNVTFYHDSQKIKLWDNDNFKSDHCDVSHSSVFKFIFDGSVWHEVNLQRKESTAFRAECL